MRSSSVYPKVGGGLADGSFNLGDVVDGGVHRDVVGNADDGDAGSGRLRL